MMPIRFTDINGLETYFKAHNIAAYERKGYDQYLRENAFRYFVPSIHITGTNGKGSTAAFIENIYVSAGYKVGLFTSPYLSKANEMMVINDQMISDEALLGYMNHYVERFEAYTLTTFEMQTIIVLTYFTEMKVDIAIIEVGMGGEVDATNIFIPKLSILTNVALEHTRYLGNTIEKITLSKAGIVKPGIPVLLGRLSDVAFSTLKGVADQRHSPILQTLEPQNVVVHEGLTFDYDG
ncbi:MAG: Mur ligase family protein, partial [Firmicutes bacterium]|nr:Mur ligase family protein [Bacillota bacterium]